MAEQTSKARSSKEAKRLASDMARIGQVLSDRYELLELLGQGGMGSVYQAKHLLMERHVAVKMLLPDLLDDPEMRQRFLREAKASGKVSHPNVIELLDFGEGPEGEAYIVMELLKGKSLEDLLVQEGAIEPARAAAIFQQICEGLAAAHAQGLVHRDLKPSNVMLVEQESIPDFVKIVDFGIAKAVEPGQESQKLTRTGEVFGSPVYMSPEQCLGHKVDARSDIYALGVLMYECLTGTLPFAGNTLAETVAKHLQEIPKPFSQVRPDLHDIPAGLEAVVMKALAKNRDERQSSMLAIKEEIFDAMLPKLRARKNAANRTMLSREANMDGPALKAASAPAIASKSERSINGKMLMILALICLGSAAGLAVFFSMQKNQSAGLQNAMPSKTETLTGKNSVKPEFGEKLESKKERTFEQAHSASRSSVSDSVKSTVEIRVKTGAKQTPKAKGSPKMQAPQKAAVLSGARRTQSSAKTAASINPAAADSPPETESKSNAAGSGLSGRRRKRDWHDYSYGFEKKEDYSHSWTVPVAGSKHGE